MVWKRIIRIFKIMVIIMLITAIAMVAMVQWKGDAIVQKVINNLETQLEDSLQYKSLHLEWFSYFPSAALQIEGLKLGSGDKPFIDSGRLDIVLRLWPLLHDKIVINRLLIRNSRINIFWHQSRWTYEVFKKSELPSSSEWNTLVHEVILEKTTLNYDDQKGLSFSMEVENAKLDGVLSGKMIDADLEVNGSLNTLVTEAYNLPGPFSLMLSGNYKHDLQAGSQEYTGWKISIGDFDAEGNGSTRKEKDKEMIDASITWKSGDIASLKKLVPVNEMQDWKDYKITGLCEGQMKISGNTTQGETPHLTCTSVLKNGSIKFPGQGGTLSDVLLNLSYDNGDKKSKLNSFLEVHLQKGSFSGHPLKADILIKDLNRPVLNLNLEGSLPAGIFNLFSSSSGIKFQSGIFNVDHLATSGLVLKSSSLSSFIEKSETAFSMEGIKGSYNDDVIEITHGDLQLDNARQVKLSTEKLTWNKAIADDVKGVLQFNSDKVDYTIQGALCQGQVESKGSVTSLSQRPVMESDWLMKGVEIKEVMASFQNFDQTFITSENIKGKTNIWAHAVIPYDAKGNILTRNIKVQAAIDIRDGELKNMKTLEDFSTYIHLEDLRDIRFNQFRNYLKIEEGKVYLPVVFIQSSAINMSVSGEHSFDQHILYHLKVNAGQAASKKLRKFDPNKHFIQARKSGWINLYYVLYGTTSSVQYKQDQKEVLSGFEQSAAVKENLRSWLVDHFGYDVYWLEPNEWEDIPEYK